MKSAIKKSLFLAVAIVGCAYQLNLNGITERQATIIRNQANNLLVPKNILDLKKDKGGYIEYDQNGSPIVEKSTTKKDFNKIIEPLKVGYGNLYNQLSQNFDRAIIDQLYQNNKKIVANFNFLNSKTKPNSITADNIEDLRKAKDAAVYNEELKKLLPLN